jgi:branched-subunit amino acid aminotransferase/4-amino-4-deoxychorismate lyase
LEEHINRFYSSCEKIGLPLKYSKSEIKRVCTELVEKNKEHNAIIYYQVRPDPIGVGNEFSLDFSLNISFHSVFWFVKSYRQHLERMINEVTSFHQRYLQQF